MGGEHGVTIHGRASGSAGPARERDRDQSNLITSTSRKHNIKFRIIFHWETMLCCYDIE